MAPPKVAKAIMILLGKDVNYYFRLLTLNFKNSSQDFD
jgi:hypothetical protein